MITPHSPYRGGVQIVQPTSEITVPDTVEFQFQHNTITVNFWVVQAIRRAIPMIYDEYSRDNGRENRILIIKGIRNVYSLGLKEAKDVMEWFTQNVDRDTEGKL